MCIRDRTSVAREVHLSESYFSTLFKKRCGTSFTEYLNAVRIEESKRLLAQGDLNVTEAAVRVGFASQSYFSKVFRRVTGMSPRHLSLIHIFPTRARARRYSIE